MAYSYNTSTKQITVTSASSTRAMYDDVQTIFTGSTYMQYAIPMVGNIKDALYTLANSWILDNATSLGYLSNGGLIDTAIANRWTNVKTISGDIFTGIQLYYNQTGTPANFASTGLVNSLLLVRSAGTDINAQAYTVYSRPYFKTYSQFTVTASSGGIDTVPMSVATDPQVTIAQATVDAYTDLSIAWATIYRSAFDGATTTKYTLNGAHTNVIATFTTNEAIDASVPASGSFQVGSEVITYTGKGANSLTGCTRGQYRTTAAAYSSGAALSTNTKQYNVQIKTTSSSRRLSELYCWVQSQLTKSTDIDVLVGGHIGKLTSPLVAYTGTMVTIAGVWVEGFSSLDNNSITYTDLISGTHTSPLTVAVVINFDTAIAGGSGRVYIASLATTGLTDASYTPANILTELINVGATGTSASTSITYTADVPVRVIVRKSGYQQFSLYTAITSTGLNVTAQNPVDSTY